MALSIVTILAVFLVMATYVQSADRVNQYCGGVKPVAKPFNTFVGTCYVQQVKNADGTQSPDMCRSIEIVTNKKNKNRGRIIDHEMDHGEKISLPFVWVQNGSNIAQAIITLPIVDLKIMGSMIYSKNGDYVLVDCLIVGQEILDPFMIFLCTKSKNPSKQYVDAIMNDIEEKGFDTSSMFPVKQNGCYKK